MFYFYHLLDILQSLTAVATTVATATAAIAESKMEVVYYIVMNYEMTYTQATPCTNAAIAATT